MSLANAPSRSRLKTRYIVARRLAMISDRRNLLILLAGAVATPKLAQAASTTDAPMSPVTAYAFSFAGLQGEPIRLSDFAGKPIVVVNTASLCGYTPQYAGLGQL